jgi:hypothetical protein
MTAELAEFEERRVSELASSRVRRASRVLASSQVGGAATSATIEGCVVPPLRQRQRRRKDGATSGATHSRVGGAAAVEWRVEAILH